MFTGAAAIDTQTDDLAHHIIKKIIPNSFVTIRKIMNKMNNGTNKYIQHTHTVVLVYTYTSILYISQQRIFN